MNPSTAFSDAQGAAMATKGYVDTRVDAATAATSERLTQAVSAAAAAQTAAETAAGLAQAVQTVTEEASLAATNAATEAAAALDSVQAAAAATEAHAATASAAESRAGMAAMNANNAAARANNSDYNAANAATRANTAAAAAATEADRAEHNANAARRFGLQAAEAAEALQTAFVNNPAEPIDPARPYRGAGFNMWKAESLRRTLGETTIEQDEEGFPALDVSTAAGQIGNCKYRTAIEPGAIAITDPQAREGFSREMRITPRGIHARDDGLVTGGISLMITREANLAFPFERMEASGGEDSIALYSELQRVAANVYYQVYDLALGGQPRDRAINIYPPVPAGGEGVTARIPAGFTDLYLKTTGRVKAMDFANTGVMNVYGDELPTEGVNLIRVTKLGIAEAMVNVTPIPLVGGEGWEYDWQGRTVMEFTIAEPNTEIKISQIYTNTDDTTVDWGDGAIDTVRRTSLPSVYGARHTYAAAGTYRVMIGRDAYRFTVNGRNFNGCDYVFRLLHWGENITHAQSSFFFCRNMHGTVPPWPASLQSSLECYFRCERLTGAIPPWPTGANFTNAYGTYSGCTGLTGSIPEWNAAITNAERTYSGCTGLTGSIPEWNDAITNAYGTYTDCTGLTGSIPEWNAAITNAQLTYSGCTGLTGSIPEWNAAITNAYGTYNRCAGLSGIIPAWPSGVTDTRWTYHYCTGLTGAWTSDPALLMPASVTEYANCVLNASPELRALFYATWGGTRPAGT